MWLVWIYLDDQITDLLVRLPINIFSGELSIINTLCPLSNQSQDLNCSLWTMWSYILSLPDQTTGKSCTSLSVHLQSLFNQNQQAWLLPRYLTFEFPYLYWQIMFSTLPCMLRIFFIFLQLLFADSVPLNHGSHAWVLTWML